MCFLSVIFFFVDMVKWTSMTTTICTSFQYVWHHITIIILIIWRYIKITVMTSFRIQQRSESVSKSKRRKKWRQMERATKQRPTNLPSRVCCSRIVRRNAVGNDGWAKKATERVARRETAHPAVALFSLVRSSSKKLGFSPSSLSCPRSVGLLCSPLRTSWNPVPGSQQAIPFAFLLLQVRPLQDCGILAA